jgi:predicted N-acetyltransferase YhbS
MTAGFPPLYCDRLGPKDLTAALLLTQALGWPHRLQDWVFMLRLGEGFAARTGTTLIGTTLAWRYGNHQATVGMVMVRAEHQGRGIGRRLMEMVLAELGNCGVLLHATAAAAPLYARLGFVPTGEVRQYHGTFRADAPVRLPLGDRLRPAEAADAERIAALDAAGGGQDRAVLIAALQAEGQGVVLEREGRPQGFALLRRFGRGHVVGPVVAPDADAGAALIDHCLRQRPQGFVRIDMPASSGLGLWLETRGMAVTDVVQAMRRGAAPPTSQACTTFALASQALG